MHKLVIGHSSVPGLRSAPAHFLISDACPSDVASWNGNNVRWIHSVKIKPRESFEPASVTLVDYVSGRVECWRIAYFQICDGDCLKLYMYDGPMRYLMSAGHQRFQELARQIDPSRAHRLCMYHTGGAEDAPPWWTRLVFGLVSKL